MIPAEEYWRFHRWLKALVRLLGAIRQAHVERERFMEFLTAHSELYSDPIFGLASLSEKQSFMKTMYCSKGFFKWIPKADLHSVRSQIGFFLEEIPLVSAAHLEPTWRAGRPAITARWKVDTLPEALKWMIWHDE